MSPTYDDEAFTTAVALVRAGLRQDEEGMRVIITTVDQEELLLGTAALAGLLGLVGCGSPAALDAQLHSLLTVPPTGNIP